MQSLCEKTWLQAPRCLVTRTLQNTALKKRVRNPIWQIREEWIRKTAPPQRYTQEPPMDTDILYKITTDTAEKNITIHKGLTTPTRSMHFTESQHTNPEGDRFVVKGQKIKN